MTKSVEELDYKQTHLGELILRVRRSPSLGGKSVFEVKLNDEFLMSSVVTESEEALATPSLDAWGDKHCDVMIGGLGLGYTAAAALRSKLVRRLVVVELLEPVIDWHNRHLVPASDVLLADPRCEIVHDDFFQRLTDAAQTPHHRYDLILLDIDHSPESLLQASHAEFYTLDGLSRLVASLSSDGVFGLWAASRPSQMFLLHLKCLFETVTAHEITYYHPMLHHSETNSVVVARQPKVLTRPSGID